MRAAGTQRSAAPDAAAGRFRFASPLTATILASSVQKALEPTHVSIWVSERK
jgi:hypothetical protein